MSDRLLTADEVAVMLGVSKDWVYAETRAGRIPHVPLGRYRRYRAESIRAWIEDLEAATLAPLTKRPRTVGAAGGMASRRTP